MASADRKKVAKPVKAKKEFLALLRALRAEHDQVEKMLNETTEASARLCARWVVVNKALNAYGKRHKLI